MNKNHQNISPAFHVNLGALFLASAALHRQRIACEVEGLSITYKYLSEISLCLATTIKSQMTKYSISQSPILLATSRSLTGYAGIIASFVAGTGYVPINFSWPLARVLWLLNQTQSQLLIADHGFFNSLSAVLDNTAYPLNIILLHHDDIHIAAERWPKHRFIACTDTPSDEEIVHPCTNPKEIAYTLFTSGSTGVPKGVMVSHAAALAMIEAMSSRYTFNENDRFTQFSDFTWDPSIVDMFLAWQCGACVCCPSAKQAFSPDKFIRDMGATITHIVPTNIRYLKKMGHLKPQSLPVLRYVFVGGEPFPTSLAQSIQEAAPNANIVNIYGSQEYSIFSTFNWSVEKLTEHCHNEILPLGKPFPGSTAIILSNASDESSACEEGELCVCGPQMFSGYFKDTAGTKAVHWTDELDNNRIFYRTGDRVRRAKNSSYIFLGRRDSLIKIAGMRIELGEIEYAVKKAAQTESAVVLTKQVSETDGVIIVAFISDTNYTEHDIQKSLRLQLPSYMLPKKLYILTEMPRNANGKCDRKALAERLRL